ncbi:Ion transport protein-domain-containing protein [Irpex rosettiformis]|uniref:Ion transport protein-domain-containing protein n=1 Tax=Irpex rosettiformis TaxID=378272 RepID=A0ACB8TXT7_9APHY|nr:Ion transport protein-domain-containing protein [Irpex rosettiformis]
MHEDPFFSPTEDEGPSFTHSYGYRSANGGTYMTSLPGPSSASLISSMHRTSDPDLQREDDEAHLTSNMSRPGSSGGWEHVSGSDAERSTASGRNRRTHRYGGAPSPLRKTGNRLINISRNLRRVSLRVVNMAGAGMDEHIRLADVEDEKYVEDEDEIEIEKDYDVLELEDLSKSMPIRGRTLGFMGPTDRVRHALYGFLVYRWTEPTILLLIIFNAVVLTIQASRNIAPSDGASSVSSTGYFHAWEDYALFALFVVFTLEMFARMAVCGVLLDPDVPVSSLFTSLFSSPQDTMMPASTSEHGLNRNPSLIHTASQPTGLSRGLTLTARLRRLRNNLARPFALAHHSLPPISSDVVDSSSSKRTSGSRARSDTVQSKTPMMEKAERFHSHVRNPSQPTFFSKALRSDNQDVLSLPFRLSVQRSHSAVQRNLPYLRHSWTRIDFIAIIGFWVCFILAIAGAERGTYHIGIFRALSVLRTTRLLAITSGTTTIMRSLKTARPLLASVAYFVLFAMIMLSIIGIQSFKGSFRRSCSLLPINGEDEIDLGQTCGGYIDPVSQNVTGYLTRFNETSDSTKGFICPLGQICREGPENPQNGIEGFDTIYYSALQVFIVSSANGWSPLMYHMMDAEFFISCFFFIVCIIVLNFWLINLFVAVITNTFSAIRKDTHKSAFGAAPLAPAIQDGEEGWSNVDGRRAVKRSRVKDFYESIRWCFIALALASLVLQATGSVDADATQREVLDKGETVLTAVFDIEMVIRLIACLPDWRSFAARGQNWLDLTLAIGSTVIQIPAIHNSSVYRWLTIFQLARFYRVILEIPRMKPLLLAVFGNMYGLSNMSLFLFMINYIIALVGVQLLRGDVASTGDRFINWGEIYNAFLGIYQVFSSENWTDVLYDAATSEVSLRQTAIVVLFLVGWFFFANYIVLQMFIAVINENFDVAEEHKRSRQASHFWAAQRPEKARAAWVRRLNPYRWFAAKPKAIAVDQLPSNLVLPMQKSLVQDYTFSKKEPPRRSPDPSGRGVGAKHVSKKSINVLQTLFTGKKMSLDVPMATIRSNKRESTAVQEGIDEETERHLEVLAALNNETANIEDVNDILYERRAQKADFIRDHPTYDKTFWIFSQKNIVRRMCQKLVAPANGERIFGTPPSPIAHPVFQLILLLTVISGIVVEWVATPLYRREYYQRNGLIRGSWFDIAETSFGGTLFLEFVIKVIADGFLFTPNAYIRSIWNVLDFMIMIGLVVNLTTGLIFIGGLSRLTRSLKALRALRLITLIDNMRSTFESLIIFGAARIFDAALLAILYMIPYAVWGRNIFSGLMNECNDGSVTGLSTCVDEYSNSVIGSSSFSYLVPRVWDNPAPSTQFSFDSFRASLLILFEIVSLEGWIDVMAKAVSITGRDQQPQQNVSQENAIFFVIYNLLGGVVILTLFISIIIGNFTSRTGSALLTQPQREWIDLQKLIMRQRPSKRPKSRPVWPFRAWCYDRAVHKHGWWHRMMTALFILHVIALMTQTFAPQDFLDELRNDFFLGLIAVYIIDILVRLYGLGWRSYSANGWNLFDIVVAGGSLITVIVVRFNAGGYAVQQLQKLFITCIAFKLVQRTNSLNKLFKTAIASLPAILSLLSLWLVMFLFFSILYVEVFSMTKWYSAENRNQNYSSMPKALVMLAFMTTGEGWNQYMHDYAIEYPRCNDSVGPLGESDCGSVGWSFTLFIAWNLLSMYIFANLFIGVVVESFNYVFQMAGGAKEITREEMRAFKKLWAEVANPKTGYLERSKFVSFFGRLSGIFEVKIYPTEFRIPQIMARSAGDGNADSFATVKHPNGLDIFSLEVNVSSIDRATIKRRKKVYNRLYHEARISYEPGRGISFTNMLLLLAHHKIIVDNEALVLQDLVVRTETNKLVTDLVDFDKVQSLLLMISQRRRFFALREKARLQKQMEEGLPNIVVSGGEPITPPSSTRDITSPFTGYLDTPRARNPVLSPDARFSLETPSRSSLQRSKRTSDISMLSAQDTIRFEDTYSRESRDEDRGEVFSSLQNSVWGEMLLEAADEDL